MARTPKYRRQRRPGKSDLGFVELDGQRFYLAPMAARKAEPSTVGWLSNGKRIRYAQVPILLNSRLWR